MGQLQVSVLDHDPAVAQAVARMLRAEGFVVRAWGSAREFTAARRHYHRGARHKGGRDQLPPCTRCSVRSRPRRCAKPSRRAALSTRIVRCNCACGRWFRALRPASAKCWTSSVTGLVVKQIAVRLGPAQKTTKTHKGRPMRKMQVRSTLALVRLMLTSGLSPLPWARHL
jgi:FixJ family two-component response regulator